MYDDEENPHGLAQIGTDMDSVERELQTTTQDKKKVWYLLRDCHDLSDPAAAKNAITELLLP